MPDEVFTQLVDSYHGALYRFAVSMTRSPDDAADLTQQAFYTWASQRHTVRDIAKARTRLFATLYREFIRTNRHGPCMPASEDPPCDDQDPLDLEADPIANFDSEIVVQAMQDVDPVFRAALTLFYLRDLTYQEIAEILDVPIGTVMSRLNRGKAHLHAALARLGHSGQLVEFSHRKAQ
jgi:RNA polymerase sigma-70 factor, ECF subfamily